MASSRTLINGTGYDIKSGRTLINGTGYDIKKGRTLINGTGYDIKFGTPVGELDVGTSVYMNVDGTRREFIVVHQGLPTSTPTYYDETCSGTWLLMKEIYTTSVYTYTSSEAPNVDRFIYENSKADACLCNTFLPSLDTGIQMLIKEINLPIISRRITILRKVFLLDRADLGFGHWAGETYEPLAYFLEGSDSAANEKRIAYYNTEATSWFTRYDRYVTNGKSYVWSVYKTGGLVGSLVTTENGLRPALVLPSDDALVDDEFNIIPA